MLAQHRLRHLVLIVSRIRPTGAPVVVDGLAVALVGRNGSETLKVRLVLLGCHLAVAFRELTIG